MSKNEKSILEKSILMCYRGSDESNKISSATRNYLDKHQCKEKINIEYINIDKRNINKLVENIAKRDIPLDIIYIYYDEENLLELIENNISHLEVRVYSLDTARKDRWNTQKGSYNGIGEDLINEYKYSLGSYVFWVIDNNKPKKIIISKYDYEKVSLKSRFYKTEYSCYEAILEGYKYRIKRNKSDIEIYERMIVKAKENINKYENKIKEVEDILDNYKGKENEVEAEPITNVDCLADYLNYLN